MSEERRGKRDEGRGKKIKRNERISLWLAVFGLRSSSIVPRPSSIVHRPSSGFTLVEASLTVALSALISLVVYSTLNNGLKIWQDVHVKQPQEDVAIFFEKLTDQVRNSFKYPGIPFTGNQTFFSFATFVRDRVQFGEAGAGLGSASYNFDERLGRVQKAELTHSDIFENRAPSFLTVLDGLKEVIFSYYFFDKQKQEHFWVAEWPPLEGAPDTVDFPLAIGVLLRLVESDKTYEYQRTIFIPYSGQ